MKINKNFLIENFKSLIYALIIAIVIRSLFFQPFYIPSSSMEPNLLVGDRIFVSKYSFGYSKHSFPFSPPIFNDRIFSSTPNRGDVIVFKTPADNRTDYIKRLIGLPGDTIQIINGEIKINNKLILRKKNEDFVDVDSRGDKQRIRKYIEYFFDKEVEVLDIMDNGMVDNTNTYIVPEGFFFVMGDNRDNSQDSRFSVVGFVPLKNLVGKAQFVFFSLENSRFFQIWKWPKSIRYDRLLKFIKWF